MLARCIREWILDIQDISAFVQEQYEYVRKGKYEQLVTRREREYFVEDDLARKLAIKWFLVYMGNR